MPVDVDLSVLPDILSALSNLLRIQAQPLEAPVAAQADLARTPDFFTRTFAVPEIYDNLLERLSPSAILRLGRCSWAAKHAVADYLRRTFSIDRLLGRFFPGCVQAFRTLQAQTATLISGSAALQLFSRASWVAADLDLYVHPRGVRAVGAWLFEEAGYQYEPRKTDTGYNVALDDEGDSAPTTTGDPRRAFERRVQRALTRVNRDTDEWLGHGLPRLAGVFTFTRPAADAAATPLKVQLILAKTSPFDAILDFHSTCVMNVISAEAAYCLYPRATLDEQRSLVLEASKIGQVLRKYAERGFRIQALMRPSDARVFQLKETRWVGDASTWTLRLDTRGITLPSAPSATSERLPCDPVVLNSWRISLSNGLIGQTPAHVSYTRLLHSRVLRYAYTVADEKLFITLAAFMRAQEKIEVKKVPEGMRWTSPEGQKYWTWWDTEISRMRDDLAQS